VIWWGGIRRTLVVLGALGVVYYGAAPYYPVAYAAVARPYCGGETENGCNLTWRDVPTEDGQVIPQCVQYCPRGVEPVAVSAAQQPPAPTGNEQGCEVKGYSEPDLQGQSFTTGDSYPTMDEWKQQVGSLEVISGTWDFYSDDNYGGESIRLTPGQYRTLGDNWTNAISSFMCSQPGNEGSDGGQGGQGGGNQGAPGGGQGGPGGGPGGPGGRQQR
jgi:hypothetical protein